MLSQMDDYPLHQAAETMRHVGSSDRNWRRAFKLVVGVVHTNYLFYARTWQKGGGPLLAETLKAVNQFMCAAYCDKVLKLSDALQPLPRALVCNVHGVRADFLDIGRRPRHRRGAYYIGKVLWPKGFRLLLDYLQLERARGEPATRIDVFGKGEDLEAIRDEAASKELGVSFHGPTDHAGRQLQQYKVFVNPSQSEVLSTTTANPTPNPDPGPSPDPNPGALEEADALAMGKPRHPSPHPHPHPRCS